jgi:hypothetical protein
MAAFDYFCQKESKMVEYTEKWRLLLKLNAKGKEMEKNGNADACF